MIRSPRTLRELINGLLDLISTEDIDLDEAQLYVENEITNEEIRINDVYVNESGHVVVTCRLGEDTSTLFESEVAGWLDEVTCNALRRNNLASLSVLAKITPAEIIEIRNLGIRRVSKVATMLRAKGHTEAPLVKKFCFNSDLDL